MLHPIASALVEAADADNAEAVQRLLANGADPNGQLSGDISPLIRAADEGHLEIV